MPAREEWLDVVDEHDRVIGRAERADAHRRGLRHRSVHVLVLDGEGRLFVQRRGFAKAVHPGLHDTSAAGHVESGETPRAAARRELEEELGIRLDEAALEQLFVLGAEPATGNEFATVFRTVSDVTPMLEADEIESGEFVARDELGRRVLAEPAAYTNVFREILERLDRTAAIAAPRPASL